MIVRRDDHVEQLKKELDNKYVINSNGANFKEELSKMIAELKPLVMFEYLGGDLAGQVFELMPNNSTLFVVGNLTHSPGTFNTSDLLIRNKSIRPLLLFPWLFKISKEDKRKYLDIVARELEQGGKIFGSKVVKTLPFKDWESAVEESVKVQSEGKLLLEI